jgi:hypothetical protein
MRGRRPVRQGAVLATAVAVVALVAPAAAGAAVPGAEDGRWYYEATGLADLHQRTTGEGVTIAVIDEAVNPAVADLGGADVQPHEPSYCAAQPGGEAYPATSTEPVAEHTTSIVTMLVGTDAGVGGAPGIPGVAPGATVRTYAVRYGEAPCETPAGQEDLQDDAIRDAVAEGADIIAVPGAASFTTDGVADALRAGAVVIAAGGNDGFISGMPSVANGVVNVGRSRRTRRWPTAARAAISSRWSPRVHASARSSRRGTRTTPPPGPPTRRPTPRGPSRSCGRCTRRRPEASCCRR